MCCGYPYKHAVVSCVLQVKRVTDIQESRYPMTWLSEGICGTTCKVCERELWDRMERKVSPSMLKTDRQTKCGHIEGGGLTGSGVKRRKGNKLNLQGKSL